MPFLSAFPRRLFPRAALAALLATLFYSSLAPASAESLPREVSFGLARINGGAEWVEIAIEVETRRDPGDRTRRRAEFNDDVEVELALAYESKASSRGGVYEFYVAKSRLVSLEEGKARVRFYLPPEALERDRTRAEPQFFRVQVSAPGQDAAQLWSPSLSGETARASFAERSRTDGPRNDGILRPLSQAPLFQSRWPDAPTERLGPETTERK